MEGIIDGVGPCVKNVSCKMPAHVFAEPEADAVIPALKPGTVSQNGSRARSGLKLSGVAWQARFKGQIHGPNAKDVADIAMKVVRLNDRVACDFPLRAKVKSAGVRRFEAWGHGNGD